MGNWWSFPPISGVISLVLSDDGHLVGIETVEQQVVDPNDTGTWSPNKAAISWRETWHWGAHPCWLSYPGSAKSDFSPFHLFFLGQAQLTRWYDQVLFEARIQHLVVQLVTQFDSRMVGLVTYTTS